MPQTPSAHVIRISCMSEQGMQFAYMSQDCWEARFFSRSIARASGMQFLKYRGHMPPE